MASTSNNRKHRGRKTSKFLGVRERPDRGCEVDFKWYGDHRFQGKVESPEIGKVIHDLARMYEGRTKRLNIDKVSVQEFVVKHPLVNVGEQFREQMKGEIIKLAPVFIQEHLRNHPLQSAPAPGQQELCLPPGCEKDGRRQTDLEHILPGLHQDSLMETSVNSSFEDLKAVIQYLMADNQNLMADYQNLMADYQNLMADNQNLRAQLNRQEHLSAANKQAGKVDNNVVDNFLSDPNSGWSGAV